MSVLIEGMKLPDMCGHCRFATAFDCEATGNFIIDHKVRNDDCPLVEIPERHGRLIDADALMKRMWEETDCMISVPATFVRDAPAVIQASEKEE